MRVRRELCVIVDGYSSGNALASAFTAHGFQTVHVRSGPTVPDVLTRTFRPHDYAGSFTYLGDDAELLAWLDRHGQDVRCVVAAAESGVLLADRLAELVGAPGNGTRLSPARRDKAMMADAVAAAAVATIPHLRSADRAEVLRWSSRTGADHVVLKPVSSSGTFGFHICRGAEETGRTFDRLIGSADVFGARVDDLLVQPFVVGEEFSVNAVSSSGRHLVTDIWRTRKRRIGQSLVYDLETLVPVTDDAGGTGQVLEDYVSRVLTALGIEFGPSHTEVIRTGAGPVLVECAARFMGSVDISLVSAATGLNAVVATAEAYLAPPMFHRRFAEPLPPVRRHPAMVQLLSTVEGTLTGYDLDALRSLPSFHGVDTSLEAGARVVPTTNSYTSPGLVFLSAADPDQLLADHAAIRAMEAAGGLYRVDTAPTVADRVP
ncbi:ATP-grasp domain-containing protein [Amycolatopsis sp. NPDC051061]|uniref:ATP-grasp domain-containing protein n=1 Tax=Amycolatopsis sp. NPDC051061 TaxID=3155042 RepID=UPI00344260E5